MKPSLADKPIEVQPATAAQAVPPEAPPSSPRREIGEPAPAAEARDREREIQEKPRPEILAQTQPQQETFNVPPPTEDAEARRKAEEAEARRKAEGERRKEEEARRIALEAEAARQQAAVRQKELEAEAIRKAEVERRKVEAEAEARQKAEVDRRKEEAARQQAEAAAQRERERLAAEQPASRAVPGAADGARPADAAPAPGPLSGRELAAKALEQLRRPGAAPADPPRPPSLPGSADPSRRRSIFGAERDVVLRMYVESWRWKIERNGTLNYRPSAGARARDNPVVTVAIRSDGSLEDVFIHRSSGLRELDEAVRRIARLYAPYSAFPPALAHQFDVIEIRRVWFFDDTLKILEEM